MKKLYEKNELTFAIVWIVVYCVLQSLANPLNKAIGVVYAASAAFCVLQTVVLFAFIRKNNLQKRYGLCKSPIDASEKRVQNTIMMAKAGGEPMRSAFSYAEFEKLLEKHGFLIYELLTPDDIQRDIIDNAGADMKAFEHVNYCLAVRKEQA